ncbi:MAG TPA: hypothetical protein VK796_09680 [Cytophaga sp.]|jgi:hypothetical protein|nr:hypothetical protein [Cytophaga sp.]
MRYIKSIFLCVFFVGTYNHSVGQITANRSFYDKLKTYDLSKVINPDSIIDDINEKFKRPEPLGFIGPVFQRFQIHFSSFKKNKDNPFEYGVTGKTKVNDNICSFSGTITITSATYDTSGLMKDIGFPLYKGGYITSKVVLYEDKSDNGSGSIKGELTTEVYFDENGKLFYQALMLISDGFANNQFEGSWTSYATGKVKKCNWGDFRIPDSGNLDNGTGEFAVSDEYVNNGWANYELAYHSDKPENKKAREKESEQWWQ